MKPVPVCDYLLQKMTSEWVVSKLKENIRKTNCSSLSYDLYWFFCSEQAAFFVPVEITIGHCIAGYVACAKEAVRIDDITSVKWKIQYLIVF